MAIAILCSRHILSVVTMAAPMVVLHLAAIMDTDKHNSVNANGTIAHYVMVKAKLSAILMSVLMGKKTLWCTVLNVDIVGINQQAIIILPVLPVMATKDGGVNN